MIYLIELKYFSYYIKFYFGARMGDHLWNVELKKKINLKKNIFIYNYKYLSIFL